MQPKKKKKRLVLIIGHYKKECLHFKKKKPLRDGKDYIIC